MYDRSKFEGFYEGTQLENDAKKYCHFTGDQLFTFFDTY